MLCLSCLRDHKVKIVKFGNKEFLLPTVHVACKSNLVFERLSRFYVVVRILQAVFTVGLLQLVQTVLCVEFGSSVVL